MQLNNAAATFFDSSIVFALAFFVRLFDFSSEAMMESLEE